MKKTKRRVAFLLILAMFVTVFGINGLQVNASQKKQVVDQLSANESGVTFSITDANGNDKKVDSQVYVGDVAISEEEKKEIDVITSEEEYDKFVGNTESANDAEMDTKDSYPTYLDNSTSNYFPVIGSQQSGSCGCWADIYYAATNAFCRARGTNAKSGKSNINKNVCSPEFVYNFTRTGEDGGTNYGANGSFMKKYGTPSLANVKKTGVEGWQYTWNANEDTWYNALQNRIEDYVLVGYGEDPSDTKETIVTSATDPSLNLIKKALKEGNVLPFSTYIYAWKVKAAGSGKLEGKDVYYKCDSEMLGSRNSSDWGPHRMTIVGYDDTVWVDINENGKKDAGEFGAFKIMNSWGYSDIENSSSMRLTRNSDGKEITHYDLSPGYFWIAYDSINKVSAVQGVEKSNTRMCIWYQEPLLYKVNTTNTYNTPKYYLAATLNTLSRKQISQLEVNVYKNEELVDTVSMYEIFAGNNIYERDLNGNTENASDGTITLDLSKQLKEMTEANKDQYAFKISITEDTEDSYPLIVKSLAIKDTNKNTVLQADINDRNRVVNGSTVEYNIGEDIEKHTVYFENKNAKWDNVYAYVWKNEQQHKIVEPVEVNGTQYTFDIYGDYKNILFKSTNDNRWLLQTKDLAMPTGENTCYMPASTNNKPEGAWVDINELNFNVYMNANFYKSFSGSYINFSVSNGTAPYHYETTIYKNGEVFATNSGDTQYPFFSYCFRPLGGEYYVVADVTDAKGETRHLVSEKSIVEPLKITLSRTEDAQAVVGKAIRVEANVTGEATYRGPNARNWSIKRDGEELPCETSSYVQEYLEFIPDQPGYYEVSLTIRDICGDTDTAVLGIQVEKNGVKVENFQSSVQAPAYMAEANSLTLSATATSGSGDYSYRFGTIFKGQTYYNNKEFTEDSSQDCILSEMIGVEKKDVVGTHTLFVEVKDNQTGDIAKKTIENFVLKPLEIVSFTSDAKSSKIKVGDTVNFTAVTGGEAGYRYNSYDFYEIKDGVKTAIKSYEYWNKYSKSWTPTEPGKYTIEYTVRDGYGQVATATLDFNVVAERIVKVYYTNSNYDNVYMHYKVNGIWTKAPGVQMERSNEQDGYTWVSEINLGDTDSAIVMFNNGNGNWYKPNGVGEYKVYEGSYGIKNGKVTKLSEIVVTPTPTTEVTPTPTIEVTPTPTVEVTPTPMPTEQDYVTVSFNNKVTKWSTVYAYVWNSDADATIFEPAYTSANEYVFNITGKYANVIFKPSKDSWSQKTADLKLPAYTQDCEDKCFTPENNSVGMKGTWGASTALRDRKAIVPQISANTTNVTVGEKVVLRLSAKQESGNYRNKRYLILTYEDGTKKEISSFGSDDFNKIGTYTYTYTWVPEKAGKVSIVYGVSEFEDHGEDSQPITLNVKNKGNTVTVYYNNTSFSNTNIHYKAGNDSWTTAPGVQMTASDRSEYAWMYTIDLGDSVNAIVCFNNGKGTWDSNNGSNYSVGTGAYGVRNGIVYCLN